MRAECPSCGDVSDDIWVVADLEHPFGCTGCIRKRGLHAVAIGIVAREAWPEAPKEQRKARIHLALADGDSPAGTDAPADQGAGMTATRSIVDLVAAAERLLGRRTSVEDGTSM